MTNPIFNGHRPLVVGHVLSRWSGYLALLVVASLGISAPAAAQTALGTTNEPATWIGGTGTNQWSNQNNWTTVSGGHAVPLVIANFTGLATIGNRVVRDQNSQSIGTLNFTAPLYVLSLENGTILTVNGAGFVIDVPANRPMVQVGSVGGGTISFIDASTGDLAKFVIASNGILDMSGRSTTAGMTAGAIDNAGRIIIANSNANSVGNELTVFGPYNGSGGAIYLRSGSGG